MLIPNKLACNNYLSSLDLSHEEVSHIIDLAKKIKHDGINIELENKV